MNTTIFSSVRLFSLSFLGLVRKRRNISSHRTSGGYSGRSSALEVRMVLFDTKALGWPEGSRPHLLCAQARGEGVWDVTLVKGDGYGRGDVTSVPFGDQLTLED